VVAEKLTVIRNLNSPSTYSVHYRHLTTI